MAAIAVRRRSRGDYGFDGGLERWIGRDEARGIRGELVSLGSVGAAADWARRRELYGLASILDYRIRAGAAVGGSIDVDDVAAAALNELAGVRRRDAIYVWAKAGRRDVVWAVSSLGRCPACSEPVDHLYRSSIYCERDAEATGRGLVEQTQEDFV